MYESKNVEKAMKKTGTTTVGLTCEDGVVLASDRRASMGYFIASKDIDKIYSIDNHLAMTIAGGVGDAQTLIRWMRAEAKLYRLRYGKSMTTEGAATLLANILSQYKFFPFFVQLLVAGIDEKGTKLYSVDMLGGVTEEKMTATGSGSPIAYGLLEEMYKEGKTVKENLRIAARAVFVAMKRDAGSGERIDLVTLTKKGFERLKKEEVEELIK